MTSKNKNREQGIVKTTSDLSALSSGLIAFDDPDRWFADTLSRRCCIRLTVKPRGAGRDLAIMDDLPKINIVGRDDEIEIQAALPGVKKEDLDILITNQILSIHASTKREEKTSKEHYRRKIRQGEFQRTIPQPVAIDSKKAKASFKDGMLDITLPKLKKTKRKNTEIK